jgi:hypothetical protein
MNHESLIAAATISRSGIENVRRKELLDKIEQHGIVVVRGLNSAAEIQAAKQRLRESFSIERDGPATGETPDDLYANYQKFSVNGGQFRANAHAQCVRSYYNPLFADDIYGMREVFRRAAQFRNILSDVPVNWAIDSIEDGFWTASRIHHYPAGGGFMEEHNEIHVPKVYEEAGLKIAYFQPLVVMSRRGSDAGCDYETGGGYFVRDGERVYYEQFCEVGDVLAYDTRVMHGVTEIDIQKPFRQDSHLGRYAAFVTLYRDFSGKTA